MPQILEGVNIYLMVTAYVLAAIAGYLSFTTFRRRGQKTCPQLFQ